MKLCVQKLYAETEETRRAGGATSTLCAISTLHPVFATAVTLTWHVSRPTQPHLLSMPPLAPCRSQVLNTAELLRDAADALIDDSFFRCFTSAPPDPWNWNWYLFPAWLLGVLIRYFVLFPYRLVLLIVTQVLFMAVFFPVGFVLKVRTHAMLCGWPVRLSAHCLAAAAF